MLHTYGDTNSEYTVLLLFHCNNVCTKAPHFYVTCSLPVLVQDEVLASSQTSILEDHALFAGYATLWL